ncbi:hypothetical protein [Puniceibacterium sp. IMCC21224]|uniref:hypothetical protein n=1 Tax=Puniceibacterium sp. IMCC21224 TaxID=1618204 RepID=UPI00065D9F54|nr:hypothetical protein [Puniceibacterium sp. IMCC21224]KMK68791.1 hypothetical protein IMCC21224_113677 [Puniceibacterium sp. IMCC21224]
MVRFIRPVRVLLFGVGGRRPTPGARLMLGLARLVRGAPSRKAVQASEKSR